MEEDKSQPIVSGHTPSSSNYATPSNNVTVSSKFWSRVKIIILILVGITIIVSTGLFFLSSNKPKPKLTTNTRPQSSPTVFNLQTGAFASYIEVKSTAKPSLQSYAIKSSELANLKDVASDAKLQFGNDKTSVLESLGFFIQPTKPSPTDPNSIIYKPKGYGGNRVDDMIDLYSGFGGDTIPLYRKPENAVFITTDFLLHIYHVLIDRTYQKIEEEKLQPALKQLTQTLYEDSTNRYAQESNPQLKESLKRLSVFYLVPLVMLDSGLSKPKDYFASSEDQEKFLQDDRSVDSPQNIKNNLQQYSSKTPSEIFQLANSELDLVLEANEFKDSPLYGKLKSDADSISLEDYSQYKPRGHYSKNSVLRSYFRALMWYGRHGFDVKSLDLTRDAALIAWQLGVNNVNGKKVLAVWESIYLPTVFFVGRSDDLTFYDYSSLMNKIYGNSVSLNSLADASKLQQFQRDAQKLEGPKILSEVKLYRPNEVPTKEELLKSTKGFRFMGQRFIPDSYMFSSLTQGDEPADPETGQKLPSTPTALMVMSVLGSNTADALLDGWIKTNAPLSDKVIPKVKNKLKEEFQKFDQKTWTQNIYWAWLYNLLPLFEDHNDGYPMFMRNLAWGKKSLISALGSWTELRHDTLLYAKQSYAELGGGPPEGQIPPVSKGYVEPNLPFLTRLIALNNMTKQGLDSKGLLIPGQKEKFEAFGKSLEFFKTIAEKELSDSIISDDEYEKLRTIVKLDFPSIVWALDGDIMTEKDARVGLIADVHTDAVKNKILYEAIGAPSIIYVAVKDRGGARLTRGAVYSYYEFGKPVGSRLTDEEWQSWIYEGKNSDRIPQSPTWINELVKP